MSVREQLLRSLGLQVRWRLRHVDERQGDDDLAAAAILSDTGANKSSAKLDLVSSPNSQTTITARESLVMLQKELSVGKVVPEVKSPAERQTSTPPTHMSADLQQLNQQIGDCSLCALAKTPADRRLSGFGVTNPTVLVLLDNNECMTVSGEKPMELLNSMLKAIDVSFEKNAYASAIVKCETPFWRMPDARESEQCQGFLISQLALLKPQLVLALGSSFIELLLNQPSIKLINARKKTYHINNVPLIFSFSPQYLLRNSSAKALVWQDLVLAKTILNGKAI